MAIDHGNLLAIYNLSNYYKTIEKNYEEIFKLYYHNINHISNKKYIKIIVKMLEISCE